MKNTRTRPSAAGKFILPNKFVRGVLVGFASFIIAFLLQNIIIFKTLEWKSWDLRLHLFSDPSKADKNIVLFLIDQYSLELYEKHQGLSWPWPRQMYSAILQYCKAGGTRACIFDLIFSESSVYGVEDDIDFANSIRESGNVFLSLFLSEAKKEPEESFFQSDNFSRFEKLKSGHKALPIAQSASLPVENLSRVARGMGNVRFSPDKDGIYRRLPLLFSYKNLLVPSLPLAVVEFLEGKRVKLLQNGDVFLGSKKIPLDESAQMLLNYHGPRGSYSSYSIASIINSWALIEQGKPPQIPPEEFEGKIILVSSSAPGLMDLRPTPFSSIYPGAEIHTTAIDNLLNGDFILLPPKFLNVFLILIFSLFTGIGVSHLQRPSKITPLFLFCLLLPAGVTIFAFYLGYWLDFVGPEIAVMTGFIGASLLNFSFEGRQRRFIKNVFRYYLSTHVIERIIKNPEQLRLGGEKRETSSFFSDIAGFTSISESLTPEDLICLLNSYLSEMTDIILSFQGTLDKYEGDAIIAFWNAPLDQADHALRACRAALECQKRLEDLRPSLEANFYHSLFVRIGINSGPAIVGNMGSLSRFDYTAIGDTVNLASRLEGACKLYDVPILIGENTYKEVKEKLVAKKIDIIRVLGKKKPVWVYELIGEKGIVPSSKMEKVLFFYKTLEVYRNRDWEKAKTMFQKEENTKLADAYIKRCKAFKKAPPPADWDGVFDLKFK